ncbi:PREDICTED: uncharacterized protein LOC106148157 [Chinchilla lanigera]|uniref:uncharacterized protein LOC106148157 n=1 Tax=Chinchilla lanigera TaxID=34839 RepID=UPI0006973B93|nr:PREDICTED: uncharacterized protein LOC106148157 [Chinchilla lanigera]
MHTSLSSGSHCEDKSTQPPRNAAAAGAEPGTLPGGPCCSPLHKTNIRPGASHPQHSRPPPEEEARGEQGQELGTPRPPEQRVGKGHRALSLQTLHPQGTGAPAREQLKEAHITGLGTVCQGLTRPGPAPLHCQPQPHTADPGCLLSPQMEVEILLPQAACVCPPCMTPTLASSLLLPPAETMESTLKHHCSSWCPRRGQEKMQHTARKATAQARPPTSLAQQEGWPAPLGTPAATTKGWGLGLLLTSRAPLSPLHPPGFLTLHTRMGEPCASLGTGRPQHGLLSEHRESQQHSITVRTPPALAPTQLFLTLHSMTFY